MKCKFFQPLNFFPNTCFYITTNKVLVILRCSHQRFSIKTGALKNFAIHGKAPGSESLFNQVTSLTSIFIKKEIMAQVFSCEIFQGTLFTEDLRWLHLHSQNSYFFCLSFKPVEAAVHAFFKIDVLNNFAKLIEKNLSWIHFLIKLQAWRSVTL